MTECKNNVEQLKEVEIARESDAYLRASDFISISSQIRSTTKPSIV